MYKLIAVTNAIRTHCTMAWSIQRNGTMANRFAAYHVTNGGKNFLLPNAMGMATSSAKVGRLMRTRQIPGRRSVGPWPSSG